MNDFKKSLIVFSNDYPSIYPVAKKMVELVNEWQAENPDVPEILSHSYMATGMLALAYTDAILNGGEDPDLKEVQEAVATRAAAMVMKGLDRANHTA